MINKITHGSLFTGLGMFDYAAEKLGMQNVYQCEIDSYCMRLLKQNYPAVYKHDNIIGYTPQEYVDIISGGFPCQDISNAKTWTTNNEHAVSGISGRRSGLWWEQHRIIEKKKPYFVVAENVAALTKKGLDVVLRSLADIGYYAEWCVIPAAWVGAPHLRKRIWIVAYPDSIGRKQESIILGKVLSEEVRHAPEWKFSRTVCKNYGKAALPEDYGIHDGNARGLYDAERMTAIGNAIVWPIAYRILSTIQDYLKQNVYA